MSCLTLFRPKELLRLRECQRLWIDLCRMQRDVAGLKAAQTSFKDIFANSLPDVNGGGIVSLSFEESIRYVGT